MVEGQDLETQERWVYAVFYALMNGALEQGKLEILPHKLLSKGVLSAKIDGTPAIATAEVLLERPREKGGWEFTPPLPSIDLKIAYLSGEPDDQGYARQVSYGITQDGVVLPQIDHRGPPFFLKGAENETEKQRGIRRILKAGESLSRKINVSDPLSIFGGLVGGCWSAYVNNRLKRKQIAEFAELILDIS